jgi:hypothetical protein
MRTTAAEVHVTVRASRERAFEHIVPIDLSAIFTGYGPLPAVSGTRDQTGPWDAAGQTRTVLLSDGSSAQEALTAYHRPSHFAYTVRGFTGILRFLVTEARGEWWFEPAPAAQGTDIRWKYEFVSRSAWLEPVVCAITQWLWRGYMGRALQLSAAQVEATATP